MNANTIRVETIVKAPIERVWAAYTSPEDIVQWNAASDDWHTPRATVDLREGGIFSSRMEARDGSMGFDFEGTYTKIEPLRLIEYEFGGRHARIDFAPGGEGISVAVSFEPEGENGLDMQRDGWQAILDNFRRHVEAG